MFNNFKKGGNKMKEYELVLSRDYIVKIKAENKEKAKEYAEIFIGDPKDESTPEDREEKRFEILEINSEFNEALDCEEIEE